MVNPFNRGDKVKWTSTDTEVCNGGQCYGYVVNDIYLPGLVELPKPGEIWVFWYKVCEYHNSTFADVMVDSVNNITLA